MKKLLIGCFILFSFYANAQDGTRSTTSKSTVPEGEIMLIPFEPKMYMSEIDKKVNEQTKWPFEKIRENFRHQLDIQLKSKFQGTGTVVSFYSDSAKMWKDLEYIYKSTSVTYVPLSNPTSTQKKSGIKNGQVEVDVNEEKKFMNTKVNNNELLSYLNQKYKTRYFVFVNELDIKNDINSYDGASDSFQREIAVHYTILDNTGKLISAGISSAHISSGMTEPKKIVSLCFSNLTKELYTKFTEVVKPTSPKK